MIAVVVGGLATGVLIAVLAGVSSAANDTFAERCAGLHGGWSGMCSGTIQTSEWGMDTIEMASDLRTFAGQAKQRP